MLPKGKALLILLRLPSMPSSAPLAGLWEAQASKDLLTLCSLLLLILFLYFFLMFKKFGTNDGKYFFFVLVLVDLFWLHCAEGGNVFVYMSQTPIRAVQNLMTVFSDQGCA